MNYSDLIDRLSEATGKPKTQTKELVESTVSVLTSELGNGNGFSIPELGTFSTKVNDVKKVYSPHYKSYILVPPKRVVDFSPASGLKENLKFVETEDE